MPLIKEVIEIIPPKDVFVGYADASVIVMEFGEYENEDCAKANEVVKQILEKYKGKIKFNFRHFPLTLIHQRSMKASEAAIGAAQTGKFWEMHNILFSRRRNLGTVSLKLHSIEAGIKDKNFLDSLVSGTYGPKVQDDLKEGIAKGVKEIPAFFINKVRLKVKPNLANLSAAIDEALKNVKKKPKKK